MSTRTRKDDSGKPAGILRPNDVQAEADVKRLAEILGEQVRRVGEIEGRLARLEKARKGKSSRRKRAKA